MWKAFVLINLAVSYCAVDSTVPSPVNVNFSSVNLRNVLQWQPGNGTPSDRQFKVQYAIYGDRVHWKTVQRCTGIVQCWCDLSSEMWDEEQGYFARVRSTVNRSLSKWALTKRFDPKSDTSFGPPVVLIEFENNSAFITMKAPMRYQPNHEKPVVSMATLYPQMMYNLSIHNTRRSKMSHFTLNSNLFKHMLMEYDTEYCFSARSKFLSMPIKCQSSAWHCITTPSDPMVVQLQMIILSTIIPFVFMCVLVVIIYLLYHYLNGTGLKTPLFLNSKCTSAISLTTRPEKKALISGIQLIQYTDFKDIDNGAPNPYLCQTVIEPPPPYPPQLIPAPANAESSWMEEGSDYGVLGVDSNQRHSVDEVDQPNVEGQAVGKTPQGSGSQRVCSIHADQNIRNLPIISDCAFDTNAMVGLAVCAPDKNVDEQEADEQDEETILISWDSQTRKSMLPERESARNGGLNLALQTGEATVWGSRAQEGERSAAGNSRVLLESVFVRQSSEEAAEAQPKLDKGVEMESKVDNFLAGWDLVFAMDE